MRDNIGWIVDADVSGYFDSIDRTRLREVLRQRVNDGSILRLIGKWLRAGVLEEGVVSHPETGVVQGGVISPVLANIFLHHVLDEWFEQELRSRSDPLQSWQCELSALEDEAPLELPPGAVLVETFAFHNEIHHEASSNVMGLRAFCGARRCLPRARETSLTGFEAQWALQHLDHFFDLVPFPVQPAHLVGG